ncbi:mRNA decapping complex subunit 2 like protein [Verticillium longisporum]|nr:mRNA decapping complex subunit 2 like protein [Verticillium longisporum]
MAAYKMQLEDWLDDLCVRFIINLPEEDLSSVARICFQIEEAQWFYEDFVRPLDPTLPSMTLRNFSLRIFQHCPLLAPFSVENHTRAFEEFLQYKTRVPVRGAILLNEDMDSTVLVKGWKKGANWSFPRGKINKDEDDLECAIREVYEETGYDLHAAGLVPPNRDVKHIEITMREQQMRLYVFRDVPMDTHFAPRTRKEISKISWYNLSELPAFRKKGNNQNDAAASAAAANANKFYMVAPFLVPLKKWVVQQKKRDNAKNTQQVHFQPQNLYDEPVTEDDAWVQNKPTAAVVEHTPALDTLEGCITNTIHNPGLLSRATSRPLSFHWKQMCRSNILPIISSSPRVFLYKAASSSLTSASMLLHHERRGNCQQPHIVTNETGQQQGHQPGSNVQSAQYQSSPAFWQQEAPRSAHVSAQNGPGRSTTGTEEHRSALLQMFKKPEGDNAPTTGVARANQGSEAPKTATNHTSSHPQSRERMMAMESSATVTISRAYFDTLIRRFSARFYLVHWDVSANKPEYDDLKAVARHYANLCSNLINGGATQATLDLLSSEESLRQDETLKPKADAASSDTHDGYDHRSPQDHDLNAPGRRGDSHAKGNHCKTQRPSGKPRPLVDAFSRAGTTGDPPRTMNDGHKTETVVPEPALEEITPPNDAVTRRPRHAQYAKTAIRTVVLYDLAETTTHADITDVVRGGMLLEVLIKTHDRSAQISFLHAESAQAFYNHVSRHDLYIRQKRVNIKWSDRQCVLPGHVSHKIGSGATRNLIVRRCSPEVTAESIRDDLEHIHNLVIIRISFEAGSCFIQTNSVYNAMFARTCMMSRYKYKGSKVEWDADGCTAPLESLVVSKTQARAAAAWSKVELTAMANRFHILDPGGLSSEDTDETDTFASQP